MVWRWDSDAFGVGEADLDPDGDLAETNVRLRFPGQYLDEETGLHYNYFRDYDPVIGRYVESDPIGLADGVNTYAYVQDNPVTGMDPTGLFNSGIHILLTLAGSQGTCLQSDSAVQLALDVALADVGTQWVWQSHMHAMCAGGLTSGQCRKNYDNFVEQNSQRCDSASLARLIHAVQDSYAGGHRDFQTYAGGRSVTPAHIYHDAMPSADEMIGIANVTRNILSGWCSRCTDCARYGASGGS